jgi:hypothetical protein
MATHLLLFAAVAIYASISQAQSVLSVTSTSTPTSRSGPLLTGSYSVSFKTSAVSTEYYSNSYNATITSSNLVYIPTFFLKQLPYSIVPWAASQTKQYAVPSPSPHAPPTQQIPPPRPSHLSLLIRLYHPVHPITRQHIILPPVRRLRRKHKHSAAPPAGASTTNLFPTQATQIHVSLPCRHILQKMVSLVIFQPLDPMA